MVLIGHGTGLPCPIVSRHLSRGVDFLCKYHILPSGSFLHSFTKFWEYSYGSAEKGRGVHGWADYWQRICAAFVVLVAALAEEFLEPLYTPLCVIYGIYGPYDC